jgi:uncharacterized protein with PIN domain
VLGRLFQLVSLGINLQCPRCGTEMEPIDSTAVEVPVWELRLCPQCYLVAWKDQSGTQTSQGIPVKQSLKSGELN